VEKTKTINGSRRHPDFKLVDIEPKWGCLGFAAWRSAAALSHIHKASASLSPKLQKA
jgi:hypothetical protein